jgi:5-methylcytosine-specific restriction endonuclease McrBC GTP-binding regulatory subunit McrB
LSAENETILQALIHENFESHTAEEKPATSLAQPTCVIFYGPPGTGKTYKTREHALKTCKVEFNQSNALTRFEELRQAGQVEFVTFHQSYDYSDFVVGYKPVTEKGAMVFQPKPGVLLRIAQRARSNPNKQYLLIMDEVNRGNISKIFGELITLVEADKRAGKDFALTLTLPCPCPGFLTGTSHDQFSLPANVHFLGTMNTADRSIALIDSALRRRFEFIEMTPDASQCPKEPIDGIRIPVLLEKLNKVLRKELTRDHQIGHAELMFTAQKYPQGATAEDVVNVIEKKVLPQIDEWFHDNSSGKKKVLQGLAVPLDETTDTYRTSAELLVNYTTE